MTSFDPISASRAVLIEVTNVLGAFRDHIVLVGGWVPDLLKPSRSRNVFHRCQAFVAAQELSAVARVVGAAVSEVVGVLRLGVQAAVRDVRRTRDDSQGRDNPLGVQIGHEKHADGRRDTAVGGKRAVRGLARLSWSVILPPNRVGGEVSPRLRVSRQPSSFRLHPSALILHTFRLVDSSGGTGIMAS